VKIRCRTRAALVLCRIMNISLPLSRFSSFNNIIEYSVAEVGEAFETKSAVKSVAGNY
jgi:hypothetical protein